MPFRRWGRRRASRSRHSRRRLTATHSTKERCKTRRKVRARTRTNGKKRERRREKEEKTRKSEGERLEGDGKKDIYTALTVRLDITFLQQSFSRIRRREAHLFREVTHESVASVHLTHSFFLERTFVELRFYPWNGAKDRLKTRQWALTSMNQRLSGRESTWDLKKKKPSRLLAESLRFEFLWRTSLSSIGSLSTCVNAFRSFFVRLFACLFIYSQNLNGSGGAGQRVRLVASDVMTSNVGEKVDVLCAFNYSACLMKTRRDLLKYLRVAKEGLAPDGYAAPSRCEASVAWQRFSLLETPPKKDSCPRSLRWTWRISSKEVCQALLWLYGKRRAVMSVVCLILMIKSFAMFWLEWPFLSFFCYLVVEVYLPFAFRPLVWDGYDVRQLADTRGIVPH